MKLGPTFGPEVNHTFLFESKIRINLLLGSNTATDLTVVKIYMGPLLGCIVEHILSSNPEAQINPSVVSKIGECPTHLHLKLGWAHFLGPTILTHSTFKPKLKLPPPFECKTLISALNFKQAHFLGPKFDTPILPAPKFNQTTL